MITASKIVSDMKTKHPIKELWEIMGKQNQQEARFFGLS
jgi:hypothetical protein